MKAVGITDFKIFE
jgi:C1A family cysteine protease